MFSMRGMREERGKGLQFPWQSPVVQGVVRDAIPWGLGSVSQGAEPKDVKPQKDFMST